MQKSLVLSNMESKAIDYNYDIAGIQYSGHRRTDPRIAAYVHAALGLARTVLNVGAGTGSYEPEDRYVIAVEPSAVMRAQRPAHRPAISGSAEALTFDDNAFDASMAMLTIHHWPDLRKGLEELRRVTKGPVVILTFDPDAVKNFWVDDYAPEMSESEARRFPSMDTITEYLGGQCKVLAVPVPIDCTDGFQEAFYARPEAFLSKEVRKSQSGWKFLPEGVEERFAAALSADLESGEWDRRYGALREQPEFLGALRLVVSRP